MCILNFQAFRVFVTKKSSSAIGLMKWSEFISKIFEFIERNIGQEKGKFLGKVKERYRLIKCFPNYTSKR